MAPLTGSVDEGRATGLHSQPALYRFDATSSLSTHGTHRNSLTWKEKRQTVPAQNSTELLLSVRAPGFANDGQEGNTLNGQVPSLTSNNNWINFCATSALPITDGQQIPGGSCNPAPIGRIPDVDKMPSTKITFPRHGDTIRADSPFTIQAVASNFASGFAVNSRENYVAAPQQLSAGGEIIGNLKVVVESIESLRSTSTTNPRNFAFFRLINTSGQPSADVDAGLPVGVYRLTITTHAANHQPVIVPVGQHGAVNDAVYFSVTADGRPAPNENVVRRSIVEQRSGRQPYMHLPELPYKLKRQDNSVSQTAFVVDPSVIAPGFAKDGQDVPAAGQVASLTSTNNFINYCALFDANSSPITNGQQIRTGSCNPAPMGLIPSNDRMPSSKFTFPLNNDEIRNGTAFTISLATANLETGNFANAQQNYLSAPQQLNSQGLIKGYALVIIEQVDSFSQITPTDPTRFAFVKGMNTPAVNGVLTANVQGGLEVGTYRMSSKIATTNHMPVVLPINQHGAVDDFVYFTVSTNGTIPGVTTPDSAGADVGSPSPSQGNTIPSQIPPLPIDSASRPNVGAIVGGAIGGLLLLVLLAWLFVRWSRKARESQEALTSPNGSIAPTPFAPQSTQQSRLLDSNSSMSAASVAMAGASVTKVSPVMSQTSPISQEASNSRSALGGKGVILTASRQQEETRRSIDSTVSRAPSYRTVA